MNAVTSYDDIDRITHAELTRIGWRWGDAGVVLHVRVNGTVVPVFVSLAQLWSHFARHLPMKHSLGCTQSAIGFWGRIKKAARSVSRGIKSVAKKVVPKKIRSAVTSAVNWAGKAVKTVANAATSDIATYALMGLSVVPGMQLPAAGLLAAQQALKRVDVGINAAKKLVSGLKATPQIAKAITQGQQAKKLIQTATQNATSGKPAAVNFFRGLNLLANAR